MSWYEEKLEEEWLDNLIEESHRTPSYAESVELADLLDDLSLRDNSAEEISTRSPSLDGSDRGLDSPDNLPDSLRTFGTNPLCSSDDDRVPDRVREAYKNSSILALGDIQETLCASNYKQKFQNLLWWEELKEAEEKSSCNEENVTVQPESDEERAKRREGSEPDELLGDPNEFKLKLERTPSSLKTNDELELTSRLNSNVFRGTIVKIQAKYVYFTLKVSSGQMVRLVESELRDNNKYNVTFNINRIPLVRCHQALNELPASSTLRVSLFPPAEAELSAPLIDASDLRTSSEPSYLLGRTLNDSQRAAVVGILESTCRPAPYIVFGPPGTGKTATIVETILQILDRQPHFKILVCGTSNDSTDVLARALFKSEAIERRKFVRLSAAYRMRREAPKDINSVTVDIARLKKRWDVGVSYSVYVTTCSQSASITGLNFDYVFVDEAGSVKEPEALIPLALVKPNGAVVLAGDPKQLGPICQSEVAKNFGLSLSMLERLYKCNIYGGDRPMKGGNFDNKFITMLSICYRCDGRILRINNEMFYFSELKFENSTPAEWLTWMDSQSPLMFMRSSHGHHQKQLGGTSKFNDVEAKMVLRLVQKLNRFGIRPAQLGIASPYRGQVGHLKNMFKRERMGFYKIETMEKFQGDEREVMIITTVIADGRISDFFKDPRRFNVATSRAKWMLILVGDPQVLRQDDCWSEYVRHAAEITV